MNNQNADNKKILLMVLPFWDPQIPPTGISCLKSFLARQGFPVTAIDANVEDSLKETYHTYFDCLKKFVPEQKRGNYYKVGFDLLHNHMAAYLHRGEEEEYLETIKLPVSRIFYSDLSKEQLLELDAVVAEFYRRLETYLTALFKKEEPQVLGISVYTDTFPASLFAFRLAKKINPEIETVMGGGVFASDLAVGNPNLEFFIEKAPYIDKILVGEGERLFLNYLRGELPEAQKVFSLKDLDNKFVDISTLDVPDFSDFDLVHYPYLSTFSSRSCPFQCEFCTETLQWGKFRKKSAVIVVEELKSLHKKHGSQLFLMSDSLLNPVATELASLLEKEDISLYWDGYLRADGEACKTENTLLWRRGGFYRARLGIESGSQAVLDLMNKKTSVQQIKDAVSSLAYAGIKTTTYWVVGFPGETEENFMETLALIEEMADHLYEADCSPFWYYQNAQLGDSEWSKKSFPLYPAYARERFVLQTWCVDLEPKREEIYSRMWRFVEHCKKLGVPNPYSLKDVHRADLRWQELQRNAAPPLVSFGRNNYVNENKNIKEFLSAGKMEEDDGDFGF
ncbi:MAG: radical SAM protein [bacterium]|nr:radical SAM protein [bacterium]